ncbi:CoA transferase, partial [Raoultella sp. 18072]|uniref:CoA transferase n=1 Tax=Raoultella sp. 18072 TaxID=2681451 RepID=UPI00190F5F59
GYADLLADAALALNNDRVRARATLLPELRRRLAQHTADELAAVFERHGLPFAPILRPEQLFDDPHLNATGGLAEVTLPDGDRAGERARVTLMPLRMGGERLPVRTDPPRLGEHTRELLEGLGYAPGTIDALREARAVA